MVARTVCDLLEARSGDELHAHRTKPFPFPFAAPRGTVQSPSDSEVVADNHHPIFHALHRIPTRFVGQPTVPPSERQSEPSSSSAAPKNTSRRSRHR